MPLAFSMFTEPWYGAQCCRMLQASSKVNAKEACEKQWLDNGWGPAELTVFPSTSRLPAAVAAKCDQLIWAGVSGTDDLRQVGHYTAPELLQTNYRTIFPALALGDAFVDWKNGTFWDWGRTAAQLAIDADNGQNRPIMFAGHSYGGAVATAAAINCVLAGYGGPIALTTFGAPKLGSGTVLKPLGSVSYVNWINDHDPIPALPPSQGEIGFPFKLTWRAASYIILPPYKFAGHGAKLDRNGAFRSGSPDPLSPTLLQIWTSADFFTDQVLDPASHLLGEYERRLARWEVVLPVPPPGAAPASPPTLQALPAILATLPVNALPPTPPGLRSAAVIATILAEQARAKTLSGAVSATLPLGDANLFSGGSSMPYIPPEFSAKKMKGPGDWAVAWEGSFIALGTRTQCLSLMKVLNHFLRRLQVMAGFDPTAFNDALTLYVQEASTGGLGFKPDQLPLV